MFISRFKNIVLLILFLHAAVSSSQNDSINTFVSAIEASNDYADNIKKLEQKLSTCTTQADEILILKTLLINNYNNDQKYDKATVYCQKEILAAQKNNLPYHEATFYLGLARTYYNLHNNAKFIQYNNQCLNIATQHNYHDLLKKCNNNLGVILLEKGEDYTTAENYFLTAIEYGKKIKPTRRDNLARNYRLLATTYDLQKKFTKADSVFKIAANIYKSFNDSLGLAEVLIFNARLFKSMKNYKAATELVREALSISRNAKSEEHIQTALSMYEQIEVETGNYEEAYKTNKEILNIEVNKSKNTLSKELATAEAKFKVAEIKNKQELEELQNKQSRQNYIYVFMVVLIITTAVLIIIYQRRLAVKEQELKMENIAAVYEAQEKERTRIAKDLHDNMGAYATSILAQIDAVELSPDEQKNEKIKNLRADAENIMFTLRETIWILKTRTLTGSQFFDLIKMYADKNLAKNLGIKLSYKEQIEGTTSLSPAISLNLYRIVQEVIQNIIKHAGATEVVFELNLLSKLSVLISDNGKGFNPDEPGRKSGLENMAYRAAEINYSIKIESDFGKGTRILISEL